MIILFQPKFLFVATQHERFLLLRTHNARSQSSQPLSHTTKLALSQIKIDCLKLPSTWLCLSIKFVRQSFLASSIVSYKTLSKSIVILEEEHRRLDISFINDGSKKCRSKYRAARSKNIQHKSTISHRERLTKKNFRSQI